MTPASIRRNTFRTWDDYFIPGTTVLKNKFTRADMPFGEADPKKFQSLEELATHVRLQELLDKPVAGSFDYPHMKAIHRHLFQDVYEWAGQERVGPVGRMNKDGHAYYPAGPELTSNAEKQYEKLAGKQFLCHLPTREFVGELAECWGELNVIHSVREGNTRTQFVFFSQLVEQAGYRIDTAQFAVGSKLRDEFVEGRFHSQDTGSNAKLAAVLSGVITASRRRT